MKKIKIISVTILSLMCFSFLFVLAGCNKGKISDVDYKCESSYGVCSVRGTFQCDGAEYKEYYYNEYYYTNHYNVTFTLYVYEDNELIAKERMSSVYNDGYSFSKVLGESINNPDNVTIAIKNVVVEDGESKLHKFTPYAIGFGVTAGVLLAGAIVVFVLDKKGKLKKRK